MVDKLALVTADEFAVASTVDEHGKTKYDDMFVKLNESWTKEYEREYKKLIRRWKIELETFCSDAEEVRILLFAKALRMSHKETMLDTEIVKTMLNDNQQMRGSIIGNIIGDLAFENFLHYNALAMQDRCNLVNNGVFKSFEKMFLIYEDLIAQAAKNEEGKPVNEKSKNDAENMMIFVARDTLLQFLTTLSQMQHANGHQQQDHEGRINATLQNIAKSMQSKENPNGKPN